MSRSSLKILFVLFLVTVALAGSSSAAMVGCFECVQYGSVGLTGPSKMECRSTGSDSWGDGWECWDGNGLCWTNEEPCYQIDVNG